MAVMDLEKLKKDGVEVKVGQRVRWKNGVEAVKQPNGRYEIVKGASKEEAQRAFDKYYKNRNGSPRGNKQARTNDINHTTKLINDTRYLEYPYIYDFKGVDAGKKVRKPRTINQLANDQKIRDSKKERVRRAHARAVRLKNVQADGAEADGTRGRKPKVQNAKKKSPKKKTSKKDKKCIRSRTNFHIALK